MQSTIERKCPTCGKVYRANLNRLTHGRNTTCSRKCSYVLRKQKQSTREKTQCLRCGKSMFVTPSKKAKGQGKYCSRECKFPPSFRNCANCNEKFRYSPSSNQRFCSKTCTDTSLEKSENSSKTTKAAWEDPKIRETIMSGIARRSESSQWRNSPHFQKGENHPQYKGNKSERTKQASRYKYKTWHKEVLSRCNYTCQDCGAYGGRLEAHHIKPWAKYPEYRYDISNGIALCEDCHIKAHGNKRKPIVKKCENCGNEFRPKKRLQKYCNQNCFFDKIKN